MTPLSPMPEPRETPPMSAGDVWRAEFYIDVALRLQLARKLAGMTQAEVSEQLGISRASYANIETARQKISVDRLWKLAVILDVSLSSLVPSPVRSPS